MQHSNIQETETYNVSSVKRAWDIALKCNIPYNQGWENSPNRDDTNVDFEFRMQHRA